MKDVRITNEEALYMSQYYASRLMGVQVRPDVHRVVFKNLAKL